MQPVSTSIYNPNSQSIESFESSEDEKTKGETKKSLKKEIINHLSEVRKNPNFPCYLEEIFEAKIIGIKNTKPEEITPKQIKFYHESKRLLIEGKVNMIAVQKLESLNIPSQEFLQSAFENTSKGDLKAVLSYMNQYSVNLPGDYHDFFGLRGRSIFFDNSLLHVAAFNGHLDIVNELIKRGADVNAYSFDCTPLHGAVSSGNIDIVKKLLDSGAFVDSNNKHTHLQTPLHRSILKGRVDMFDLLINKGANINAKAYLDYLKRESYVYGLTPLHFVAVKNRTSENDRIAMAKVLIAKGAAIDIKDGLNLTPYDLAKEAGLSELCKYLKPQKIKSKKKH